MKSIKTLVADIESVVLGNGGWDATLTKHLADNISLAAERRFGTKAEPREGTLRMSNIGSPCKRKLWYHVNNPPAASTLKANTLLKFAYGDIIESLLLSLAKASGHTVEGEQDEIVVDGIVGHRDCVIDGVTVDIKSASSYSFKKFEQNGIRKDDPFGYLAQLTGYVYAGKDDPLVKDKAGGAFLVMDKVSGDLCLDYYNLTTDLFKFPRQLEETKAIVKRPAAPPRQFKDMPDGKSGNMKLDTACSYCDYHDICWPGLRTFFYSSGPIFLTKVVNTPKVPEKR